MKVADMHCDTIYEINRLQREGKECELKENHLNISIDKMMKGDYLIQNFAMFTHLKDTDNPITHVQRMIDTFYNEMEKNKDLISVVYSYNDINADKLNAMLTLEEGGVVNNDLSYLRNYYRLGVRMITLTWNFENGIGYPNFDINGTNHGYNEFDDKNGLTEFGIEYIKEMERLGMIIDVSHLSDAGFYDVLKYTKAPFVASHSNSRTMCPHARNMSDEMIIKLAKRGGVIGINYAADFLDESHNGNHMSKVESMVRHIEYIKSIAGIDVIGLGSDFDGIPQNLELKDCSYMPMLEKALYDHGFTKEEVEKIFYKNVLRVYRDVLK